MAPRPARNALICLPTRTPSQSFESSSKALSQRHRIAEAAYFRAEQRRFAPGQEVDDWLAAEKEILSTADSSIKDRKKTEGRGGKVQISPESVDNLWEIFTGS